MKCKLVFIGWLLFTTFIISNCSKRDGFPVLKGPYLGQKIPGMTPEIFAPGILNTDKMGAFCTVFSPDGNEFYFTYWEKPAGTSSELTFMKKVNNIWTKPEMLNFNSTTYDNDMCLSVDGKKLIFRSFRALPSGVKPNDHSYLWFVERTEDGWSEAKPLFCGGEPVRTGYPSISKNGRLYFAHRRDNLPGIYRSKYLNREYSAPEFVCTVIDTQIVHGDMFVAPDESYMIISCRDRDGQIGNGLMDLYIVFQKDNGSWTEARNMDQSINTQHGENCPQVSPDGKYFFFNRYDPDTKTGNMYWVDAKIIENYKPVKIE